MKRATQPIESLLADVTPSWRWTLAGVFAALFTSLQMRAQRLRRDCPA